MQLRRDRFLERVAAGVAVAVLALVWHVNGGIVVAAQAPKDVLQSGPQIGGCPVFPADNVWNTPITSLKRDARSDAYVQKIGADKPLHPNFGSDPRNGMPYTILTPNVKYVKVKFLYKDESDQGNYPMPDDPLVEGGSDAPADSDRHVILIDEKRCMLIEFLGAKKLADGSWAADAGVKMDLTSNALRPEGMTSTDAAGLAVLPGLLRYDEVDAGEVRHAVRFTAPKTQRAYVWPARHFASRIEDPTYPPLGQRFRLRADVDISGYSKVNQVILNGLKKYGMILSDNGSPWFIIGVPDKRWDDEDLSKLKALKGSDFEAVDESEWQMHADSGRVDPVSLQ